jgi:polar amino acid transport system substrate-binding protein
VVASEAVELRGKTLSACDDANEWPPYAYWRRVDGRPSQELTGYTVELIRRIAARRGFQLQIQLLPWKRCLEAVRQGEILMLLNSISTPERERDYWISPVLYESQLLVLWSSRQHPEGLVARKQAELVKLRIGGLHGYSYSQLGPIDESKLIRAPNYQSLLQMLHLGRVDVALVNEAVMLGHAALGHRELGDADALRWRVLEDRQPSRFHVMTTRARPEGLALQQAVAAELPLLERSGELARLRQQFLGSDNRRP